jgi:hypothetical protein
MNPIHTNFLAIEIAPTDHAANGAAAEAAEAVPVVVFPLIGGRCCGTVFNASPCLASGRKPSTAAQPATPITLGLRPRTVSFRARSHA